MSHGAGVATRAGPAHRDAAHRRPTTSRWLAGATAVAGGVARACRRGLTALHGHPSAALARASASTSGSAALAAATQREDSALASPRPLPAAVPAEAGTFRRASARTGVIPMPHRGGGSSISRALPHSNGKAGHDQRFTDPALWPVVLRCPHPDPFAIRQGTHGPRFPWRAWLNAHLTDRSPTVLRAHRNRGAR